MTTRGFVGAAHRVRSLVLVCFLVGAAPLQAQVDEAREALRNGEYERAASVLSTTVRQNPSADAYIYLAVAYAHLRNFNGSESTLIEGAGKYPEDPRFHNELAGLYVSRNNLERARSELRTALRIDPENLYAFDLLANLDLSQGHVREALAAWAEKGGPVIAKVFNDGRALEAGHRVIARAVVFESGDRLGYGQWRTTEQRLFESGLYNDVRLQIQPTTEAGRYHADISASLKRSTQLSYYDLALQYFSWTFTRFVRFGRQDIGRTGISLSGGYRPSSVRHRGELRLLAPLPLPGGLVAEGSAVWRSERWDLSRITAAPSPSGQRYESTGWRVMLKALPDYRVEVGAGFEFTNRKWSGKLPAPVSDIRDSGKLLLETTLRPVDRRYQNRVRFQGFLARKSMMGDMDYSGGTAELNNRFSVPKLVKSTIDVTLKAGTSRGQLPLDEYFVLGAGMNTPMLMRGHSALQKEFGAAPMGTDYLVANLTVDRHLQDFGNRVFFLPSLTMKVEGFVDGGKMFDRTRVFRQGQMLVDAGGGLRFETPTHALHLIYGHAVNDSNSLLGVYVEKRW